MLKNFLETAMGVSINAQHNWESDYVESVQNMCKILIYRTLSPIKMIDFLYKFTNDYKIEKKSLKILHNFTNSVIKKRIQQLEMRKNDEKSCTINDVGLKERKTFLDQLLGATIDGKSLTYEEIREEVDTFMFAVGYYFKKNY